MQSLLNAPQMGSLAFSGNSMALCMVRANKSNNYLPFTLTSERDWTDAIITDSNKLQGSRNYESIKQIKSYTHAVLKSTALFNFTQPKNCQPPWINQAILRTANSHAWTCNYVAFLSLGDLSKLDKHFDTVAIRAVKQYTERKRISFWNHRLGEVIPGWREASHSKLFFQIRIYASSLVDVLFSSSKTSYALAPLGF